MMGLISQDLFSNEAEFFKEVLQAVGVGLWAYEHATDTNIWSPQLLAILGVDEGEGPNSLNEWLGRIHPEDQARVRSCLEAAFEYSNRSYDIQYRYLHRQGHWVWLHDLGRVIKRNPDGSPLLTAGIASDITQSRQAESALVNAEQRFRDLVEQIPVGVYTLETFGTLEQSRFLFVSDRLCQLVGFSRSQLMQDVSIAFNSAIPDDYGRLIKANQDAYLMKEPFHFEGQFLVRDQIRWLSISSHPTLSNDAATLWDGVVTDITDRKQAELTEKSISAELEARVAERTAELAAITAKAQFSEERLRHALEASNTGVVDWNIKTGDIFYLFPQQLNDRDPLPSKEAFELWKSLIHPDDLNEVVAYLTGHTSSADNQEMEYRLRFSDGRYHWVLAALFR